MSRLPFFPLLLVSAFALVHERVAAIDASFPAAWSGGSGTTDSFLVPDADRPPYDLFEQGLTGRARVLFTKPGKKAPDGAYSGTITLLDDGVVKVFRGKGTPGADGSIDAPWIADGSFGSAQIKLRRVATDPQALVLHGDVTVGARKYPLFLVPEPYSKKAPYAGSATVPGPGNYNFFLVHPFRQIGSGSGSALIGAGGAVKFAGALPDGSKIAATVPVLATAGRHFLLLAATAGKGGGFVGGWVDGDRSRPDSDWRGAAIISMPGLGTNQEIIFSLSAFQPPAGGSPISWRKGLMQIESEYFSVGVANGRVDFDGRSRFTAEPRVAGVRDGLLNLANASAVRLVSLTMDARRGVVGGQIKFFEDGVTLTGILAGALNQKSGVVEGRMLPIFDNDEPGYFDIIAAPAPTITGFAPSSAPVDTSIFISGTGFTGATAVAFNGVAAASFTVNSATQIAATVPAGATTGKISVTTPAGVLTSVADFSVIAP